MADADDDDRAAIIAANAEFYRAFSSGDFAAMDALWSERADIVCIHPGWPPVRGRRDVMASWRGILADPPSPAVQAADVEVYLMGEAGLVICFETIGEIFLTASNMFAREAGRWRMVHHHAGVTEHRPRSAPRPPSGTVH
ncbi:MAG: nuclear transport factor 2 family protein [Alphaproteobacteria bacterium]|nr:nuclear transport factor 2 family protein [Alphaproteobacteria bacterium]